ncbi:hypothetical protein BZG01_06155 [Labilibaculum manganireducens]|uniref:PNPLA domain-containing protein n=1 Tax=Labilibaculum manganireducens TaxID=1940525 RepID=A0A2N3IC62_9BACT|nr:patatin-like phospholipase family protein [Labilibaculum manganireducens]PKQ67944.1 hypothetical protein BZG01_06155 [Labilibaculum manganireducens]
METKFEAFESIGLCFSGGGYRATFFSLGVISYLNKIEFKKKPLLSNVEAISSVSGGTLLAVAYAKAVQDSNFKFDSFYDRFYSTFTPGADRLLENAISKLEDNSVWKNSSYKKRSLINAFALAYSDLDIFKGKFEMFKNMTSLNLKHVCFNATDFSFGLAFRFQSTGKFGNNPLNCTEINKINGKIDLADIVASSSCFPIGFEPLLFPDDYFKDRNDLDYKALKRLDNFAKGVGIMDGGIVDNQGIGSMMNINKSMEGKRGKALDLIIVNDVGSYKMVPWLGDSSTGSSQVTVRKMVLKLLNYFRFHWAYWATLLAGIVLMLINSLELIKGRAWPSIYVLGGVVTGIGFCLSLIGVAAGYLKSDVLRKVKSVFEKNVPEELLDEVMSFQRLDIDLVKRMLIERATSGAKMVSDVFLKQIRRLNYNLIYSKEELKNRIITSTVYKLNGKETLYKNNFKHNIQITPAGKQLKQVALIASEAPTSLWWDKEDVSTDRMDSLIACGQFTTCFNLMNYILELKENDISSKEIDDMYKLLEKDWRKFNENPLFMV